MGKSNKKSNKIKVAIDIVNNIKSISRKEFQVPPTRVISNKKKYDKSKRKKFKAILKNLY